VNLQTKMKLSVLPGGDVQLQIGHIGEGYEILMTRWLKETGLCTHEAYYEDMSVHVDYYSYWADFESMQSASTACTQSRPTRARRMSLHGHGSLS